MQHIPVCPVCHMQHPADSSLALCSLRRLDRIAKKHQSTFEPWSLQPWYYDICLDSALSLLLPEYFVFCNTVLLMLMSKSCSATCSCGLLTNTETKSLLRRWHECKLLFTCLPIIGPLHALKRFVFPWQVSKQRCTNIESKLSVQPGLSD